MLSSRITPLRDPGCGVPPACCCNRWVDTDLRMNISTLGLSYVAGIQSHTTVWAPGTGPRPPKKWLGRGRRPKLLRRDEKHKPVSVKQLAPALPGHAWRKITCREAPAGKLASRFAR